MPRSSAVDWTVAWDDVRLFLSLCRSRTLSEAGRRVGVDASTMSRRLAALERSLKASLFERGREGIVATEAARELQPVAEEMEHAMARFSGTVESFERDVSGPVRITSPSDAAQVLVVPLLPELLARHPHLQIELAPGEGLVDMARREADLALRTARPSVGDLLVKRLRTVHWRFVAAPELVERAGALRSLAHVPWILGGSRLGETPTGRWLSEVMGGVHPAVRSDSLSVQLACAQRGLGAVLVPELSREASGLVALKLSRALRATLPPWPEDELYLVTHRSLRSVPRVRAAWEFFSERAGDSRGARASR